MNLAARKLSRMAGTTTLVAMLTAGSRSAGAADLGPLSSLPLGDTDGNGAVEITDALRIAQYYVGLDIGRDLYIANADVNGDLSIDIVDAQIVAQYQVGLIKSFPVANTIHSFADSIVAAAVRRALGKADGAPVSRLDLRSLRTLTVRCSPTTREAISLADVPYLVSLGTLRINYCRLADLTPLSTLAMSQPPKRAGTTVTDPTRPTWYTRLGTLDLHYTDASDVTPLSGFSALESLDLGWNSLSSVTPLASLRSLKVLDLSMSGVQEVSPLADLPSLQKLDLSWTTVQDVSPLEQLPNLEELAELDVRVTGVTDLGLLAELPSLYIASEGRELVTCRPGAVIGDYDGDNLVTAEDAKMLRALLSGKGAYGSAVLPSDDIRCIDLNGSGLIDENDAAILEQLVAGTTPSRGQLTLKCSTYAPRGDADGDGRLTQGDVDLVDLVVMRNLPVSGTDLCCLDVDRSGTVTSRDRDLVQQISQGTLAPQGVCGDDQQGLGIVTYDLAWTGANVHDVPVDIIRELHSRVLSNLMLEKTDMVVFPEYAYSSLPNPVQLNLPSAQSPYYTIANDNPVATMVRELLDLSRQRALSMVVPLAELMVPTPQNQFPCPTIMKSALLIDKGNIRSVKRVMELQAECEITSSFRNLIDTLQRTSFQIYDLQARGGQRFTSTLAVCAESRNADFVALVKGSHPDLILFPEGVTGPTGRDKMVHIQLYQGGASFMSADSLIRTTFQELAPYTDYVVHAALSMGPMKSQGIYSTALEPLPYIFTRQFDDGGYLYARVNLK